MGILITIILIPFAIIGIGMFLFFAYFLIMLGISIPFFILGKIVEKVELFLSSSVYKSLYERSWMLRDLFPRKREERR